MSYTAFPAAVSAPGFSVTVNGTNLSTLAYNINTVSGTATTSGLRGANSQPAGRDGELYTQGKRREVLTLKLTMWASPLDPITGAVPTTLSAAYQQWRMNQDLLYRLFDSTMFPLDVRITHGSSTRQGLAEVVAVIEPNMQQGAISEFNVELRVLEGLMQDPTDVTWSSGTGATIVGTNMQVSQFANSSANMVDLSYEVKGPIANPTITDVPTGHFVQYTGSISTGVSWFVDSKNWTSIISGNSVTLNTTSSGPYMPRLMGLSCSGIGGFTTPTIQLTGNSAGATTQVIVTGRRKYK